MATDVLRPPVEGDELYTLTEACAYLKISPATMRRRVKERRIRFIRMGGVLRFWRSALDEYLAKQTFTVEPTPASQARAAGTPTPRSQATRKGRAA